MYINTHTQANIWDLHKIWALYQVCVNSILLPGKDDIFMRQGRERKRWKIDVYLLYLEITHVCKRLDSSGIYSVMRVSKPPLIFIQLGRRWKRYCANFIAMFIHDIRIPENAIIVMS